MATIKSYTDLEQSRKLAKILSTETADMFHLIHDNYNDTIRFGYEKNAEEFYSKTKFEYIPCWSLSALLGVIPNYKLSSEHNHHTCTAETNFGKETVAWFDNPVDACYDMIIKLKEQNLI